MAKFRYTVVFELDEQHMDRFHGGKGTAAASLFHAELEEGVEWPFRVVARRLVGPNELPLSELGPDVAENSHNYADDPVAE